MGLIGYASYPDANLGRHTEFDGRAQVGPTFPTKFWQPKLWHILLNGHNNVVDPSVDNGCPDCRLNINRRM